MKTVWWFCLTRFAHPLYIALEQTNSQAVCIVQFLPFDAIGKCVAG